MNSAFGWPIVECTHYLALAMLFGSVGLFDLRMLGLARGVSMSALHKMVPIGVAGFALSVTTGAMFFIAATDQYLYNPAFQLKMLCMVVAGANMLVFYATMASAVKSLGPDDAAPRAAKWMAAISLTCWIGVVMLGRVITMFRPPYHWCFWC